MSAVPQKEALILRCPTAASVFLGLLSQFYSSSAIQSLHGVLPLSLFPITLKSLHADEQSPSSLPYICSSLFNIPWTTLSNTTDFLPAHKRFSHPFSTIPHDHHFLTSPRSNRVRCLNVSRQLGISVNLFENKSRVLSFVSWMKDNGSSAICGWNTNIRWSIRLLKYLWLTLSVTYDIQSQLANKTQRITHTMPYLVTFCSGEVMIHKRRHVCSLILCPA